VKDIREVHTSQGLFTVAPDRPGEPNSPRSLKILDALAMDASSVERTPTSVAASDKSHG